MMPTKLLLVRAARLHQRVILKRSIPAAVTFSSARAFRAEVEDADPDMVRRLGPIAHELVANCVEWRLRQSYQ